jgi:hypothetical protein
MKAGKLYSRLPSMPVLICPVAMPRLEWGLKPVAPPAPAAYNLERNIAEVFMA